MWWVSVVIWFAFAFVYKIRVVNKIPAIRQQYASHFDDYQEGIFSCFCDTSTCLHTAFCPLIRASHNWDVAGVMNYWVALLIQFVLTFCGVCCVPACFYTFMQARLKRRLGIEPNFPMDCFCNLCCLPCAIGQAAMAVDDITDADVRCCCSLAFYAGSSPPGKDLP